ncbi:hypothetical protein CRUP_036984 [Coryphaenoides rupestris]|nr:hypothetical protein CRUP_036984 [Coryphaenoides rupestris]
MNEGGGCVTLLYLWSAGYSGDRVRHPVPHPPADPLHHHRGSGPRRAAPSGPAAGRPEGRRGQGLRHRQRGGD